MKLWVESRYFNCRFFGNTNKRDKDVKNNQSNKKIWKQNLI